MQLQCLSLIAVCVCVCFSVCVWAPLCVFLAVWLSAVLRLLSHCHLAVCVPQQHGSKSCYCCHCAEALCIRYCCSRLLLTKEQVSVSWKPAPVETPVLLMEGGSIELITKTIIQYPYSLLTYSSTLCPVNLFVPGKYHQLLPFFEMCFWGVVVT